MTQIRKAKFKDLETIANFQQLMAKETENIVLQRDILLEGIEAVFEDPAKGTYYVATTDGENVIACLLITPEWSEWRNGTVMWIQSVYVDISHRAEGVFREMYSHIRSIVEADPKLSGIRLYVEKENVKAQRVYEKLGMNGEHYKLYEWLK